MTGNQYKRRIARYLLSAYGSRGIRVSCLCPQGVRTPMIAGGAGASSLETVVAQGLLEPEDVARSVTARETR